MNILQLFQSEYISIIAGGLGGIVTAWLTQRVLNKRGIFTYSVTHTRVGVTAEDAIFGNVAVSWNGNPVQNLYLSTIEMKNESMNDYENVVVNAFTNDTLMMTEQTQLLDTPNILEWSEKYKNQLHVEPGSNPSEKQWTTYNGQREYIIPIFNRSQSIKITYLNSAKSNEMPSIWLSIAQKGVKLKFRGPQNQILGVPQNQAAFVGVLLGVAVLVALVIFVAELWAVAIAAMTYGLVAQLPGAYAIKAIRRLREAIGG
ncbi:MULTISPECIES: hypothetical protein [Methylomonas]|uniref:Uncharacterized protein n=2 Tax=Methylomonas TaxID=416 RepID=A0A126T7U9_9GAMM|nr:MULTISPECIES: hypothetical protein [Methylomonas]AMK77834.1 hypothetical protein JT25_015350 [Methylomonas denitrificans]OAI00942.1 hypothetical protein A1342_16300 [Methylomonas methanica]TCV87005.1 hypothetical protein EDE11_103234 [Methylomonas methanica]